MHERICAETILRFVTEIACPYGPDNTGDGNKAREKIVAIRSNKDKGLDWRKLDAEDAEPWNNNELKGVKAAIASDLKSMENPEAREFTIGSFNDVKKVAELCIHYGTGRCIGLVSVALIRARELAPHISVLIVNFFKEVKNQDGHAILLIGVNRSGNTVTPTMNTWFCDPWKNKVGPITEYKQHIESLGYTLANCVSSKQAVPDNSVSSDTPITSKWLLEREETISKIEEIYLSFLSKNIELQYTPITNQSVLLLKELTQYPTFGFWQSRKDYVVGARIYCETRENKETLTSKFSSLQISTQPDNEEYPESVLIVNDINGDNARKIDMAYRRM